MRQPSLNDLSAFLAIAERGSFRQAARQLGVSPSALSHSLRALEDRLGARLLNRTTRSVALTEAGNCLAERLRPAMAGMADALSAVADNGEHLKGRIRISTGEYGAKLLVGGAIAEFRQRHPGVEFELIVDNALVDIVADGFDAGVRFHEQVPPDMIAVPITAPARMVAFASPSYLARRGTPTTPAHLLGHECIRQRLLSGAIYRWEFEDAGRSLLVEPRSSITLNSIAVIIQAALAGLGVGFVPSHHMAKQFEDERLIPLLQDYSPKFDGQSFYYPSLRHPTRAFRAFVDQVRNQPLR